MEACRCVEFSRGSCVVATIDSAYHKAGGDPFMGASILRSTQDTQPPTASAAIPTTTGSLAMQRIWRKEQ